MAAVSIYNVLRTVAQVQVAQAMAKVDGAIVTLPQMSSSPQKPTNTQPVAQDRVPAQIQTQTPSAALSPQARAQMAQSQLTQTLTDTVDRILSAAHGNKAPLGDPTAPRPQTRPPQSAQFAPTAERLNPQQPAMPMTGRAGSNVPSAPPILVRAITLASLPTPDVIKSLGRGALRVKSELSPSVVQTLDTGSVKAPVDKIGIPAARQPAQTVLQGVVAQPSVQSQPQPLLPVVTRLLAQVADGEITEAQFVKTLVSQILTGRPHDQASPAPSVPRPLVSGSPILPLPPVQAPQADRAPTERATAQASVSQPAPQPMREPVAHIIGRFDPTGGQPLQMTPSFSVFPHALSELAIPVPVTMQALGTMTQVPPQFKDLAGLVAYYAAMLPGWPNPDAQRLKRPKDIPVPLIQLAQAVKHLSPEQQIALLSRMGMPFGAIQVLQKMLKDLDKKLNAKTVETFLAAFLGTLSFVVEEVVTFFDDLSQVLPQEHTN